MFFFLDGESEPRNIHAKNDSPWDSIDILKKKLSTEIQGLHSRNGKCCGIDRRTKTNAQMEKVGIE